MQIRTIKTAAIRPGEMTLAAFIDSYITELEQNTVVAVTSKVVSLCEGSFVSSTNSNLNELIREQSSHYQAKPNSQWNFNFTVTQNTLIANAGIDKSNADGVYVLWPVNPQESANAIREQLVSKFNQNNIGVVVTDSTVRPMRRGVSGIALAHSGFLPLRNYVGKPDLFGRPFAVAQSDISGGLAAAAVMVMGEGAESTPLALLSNLESVEFTNANPTVDELAEIRISLEDDLFAPFLQSISWQSGRGK